MDILPQEGADVGGGANTTRITTRFLTKYERARILGTRALQIRCVGVPCVRRMGMSHKWSEFTYVINGKWLIGSIDAVRLLGWFQLNRDPRVVSSSTHPTPQPSTHTA